jgi:hypothetical protein
MLPERGRTLNEEGSFRKIENLLATEAHPDQVEGRAHAEEESDQGEKVPIEEVIEAISDTTPDQKT